jgi:hypothetical protein
MLTQIILNKLLREAWGNKKQFPVNSWRWLSWCMTIHSYIQKSKELKLTEAQNVR